MWLWTLPSDSRPMKWTVPPALPREATACHAAPRNSVPWAMASLTSSAPCANTRPAPRALCPTSEFPMSSSDGSPTAVPCALSFTKSGSANSWSSVGLLARNTPSDASRLPRPTPSRMASTSGPLTLWKPGIGSRCNCVTRRRLLAVWGPGPFQRPSSYSSRSPRTPSPRPSGARTGGRGFGLRLQGDEGRWADAWGYSRTPVARVLCPCSVPSVPRLSRFSDPCHTGRGTPATAGTTRMGDRRSPRSSRRRQLTT